MPRGKVPVTNANVMLWRDILVLYAIIEYLNNHEKPPSQRELHNVTHGLVNDFIEANNVPAIYSRPFTSNEIITQAIAKLRQAGLLSPKGEYHPTDSAIAFFQDARVGQDWSKWPISVPLAGDAPDLTRATYLPAL